MSGGPLPDPAGHRGPDAALAEAKRTLRAAMRARLQALPLPDRDARSRAACAAVVCAPWFAAAESVFAFVPLRDEIDTTPLLEAVLAAGKQLVVPRVVPHTGELEAVAITNLADLRPSSLGVREPEVGPCIAIETVDVAIVPGLAFDRTGARLGRGGGFYDRCLGRHPELLTCGLAWTAQILDHVPVQPFDRPVRWLATEDGAAPVRGEADPMRA